MPRRRQRAQVSERWEALCMKAGDTLASQLLGCEKRISRAVVDLEQSQATFASSLKFTCNADGELKLTIGSREPTLKIDPVEIKLSSVNGQLGLFEGERARPPADAEGDDADGDEGGDGKED